MDYLYLFGGLVVLLISGDFLLKGSVSLAGHFKVSKLIIGVVIVSFGTSVPELMVSVKAALSGHPDIAIGNVIGSNISNIALILGFTAILIPIHVKKKSICFDWSVMMFASVLLLVFTFDLKLQFVEGLIFIVLIIAYIFKSIYFSRKENIKSNTEFETPKYNIYLSLLFVAISIIGLVIGANLLVSGGVGIARDFGVSERVISVSIIAFGTSLPELVTSIVAATRKELDIFIGNIIGSNIFNLLAILGITSMLKTINVNPLILKFDIYYLFFVSILLLIFMLPLNKGVVTRWKGLIFVLVYCLYIYLVFI